jgi:uncharacterized protein YbbC (DUF1343 family)
MDETDFPWVMPSPNMPTLDTATVYPGQVMREGTTLSEGRGTARPFELFGAPWIEGFGFGRALQKLALPGVVFREAWFTPSFSKFAGERCGGCQLHVTDRDMFRPVVTTLAVLQTVRRLHDVKLAFHAEYFDHVLGTSTVRESLEAGEEFDRIARRLHGGITRFAQDREPFLLYT